MIRRVLLALALCMAFIAGVAAVARAQAPGQPPPLDRYRFTLTSPADRGLLVPVASVFRFLRLRALGVIRPRAGTKYRVVATAYSSTVAQTDRTPCITAAGTRVRHGIVATNFLPLGTVLQIAGVEFVVTDRMNERYNGAYIIDVWYPTTPQARDFGKRPLEIEIVRYQPLDELREKEAETFQRLTAPTVAEQRRGDSLRDRLQRALERLRSFAGGRLVVPQEEDCLSNGS